jgi:hypothetical protein
MSKLILCAHILCSANKRLLFGTKMASFLKLEKIIRSETLFNDNNKETAVDKQQTGRGLGEGMQESQGEKDDRLHGIVHVVLGVFCLVGVRD